MFGAKKQDGPVYFWWSAEPRPTSRVAHSRVCVVDKYEGISAKSYMHESGKW